MLIWSVYRLSVVVVSVQTLLTDPDRFFGEQGRGPSLIGPVLVVAAAAAVDAVASVLRFRFTSQVFESAGAGGFATAFQAVSFVVALVGPFVVWLVYAGIFHAISTVFDGDGEFSTTLAFVGWGFLPSVLGSAAAAAVSYYRFDVRGVEVPPEMTPQVAREFTQSVQTGPLVALPATLGVVFTLWSGFFWTFALKNARDLSDRQAALTIVLPVVLGVLASVWQLVNALEVLG